MLTCEKQLVQSLLVCCRFDGALKISIPPHPFSIHILSSRFASMAVMKNNTLIAPWIVGLALLSSASVLLASDAPGISDLAGQWHGKSRFTGISYEEATQKKVSAQDVETALRISADGTVTGRIGGAGLKDCVVESNRGWFGRLLHIKTDFVIRGKIAGAVAPGSDGGPHPISVPFNLKDSRMAGTVFVTYSVKYPYPFLSLGLSREP